MGLYNSYQEFETSVKSLLSGETYIPLVLTFEEPLIIDEVCKKPVLELKIACAYCSMTSGISKVMFKHKAGVNYDFYLSVIPYQYCSGVYIHPDFSPADGIASNGIYSNAFEFETGIKKFLTKNIRTSVILEFSQPVFLHDYNIEPADTFKITASIIELSPSGVKPPVFKPRAVFYIKPSGQTFYYPKHFPYHCITNITPEKDFHPTITTRSRRGKTINLKQKSEEQITSDQISLYEIISQSSRKAKFRDDSHCIICGNGINKETTDFVRLLLNGNLSSSYKLDSLHFDYLPVGPDCKHKFPEAFVFTNSTIREYCDKLKEEKVFSGSKE